MAIHLQIIDEKMQKRRDPTRNPAVLFTEHISLAVKDVGEKRELLLVFSTGLSYLTSQPASSNIAHVAFISAVRHGAVA